MAKIPYMASTPIVPDGGSTTTTTTTTTATSPYAQFKGNNYAELEEFLQNQMKKEFKVLQIIYLNLKEKVFILV